jgi:Repeat of unknown function (DUF346)
MIFPYPIKLFLSANPQQHVFFRDTKRIIQHVFWDSEKGFQYEPYAGGPGAAANSAYPLPPTAGNLALMLSSSSDQTVIEQHVFYRGIVDPDGLSGNIFHAWWDSNTGFHGENYAGAVSPGVPVNVTLPYLPAGDPAVFNILGGSPAVLPPLINGTWWQQQHVFYRDVGGRIQHAWWDSNSGFHGEQWAGPGPISRAPNSPVAAGDPTVGTYVIHNTLQQHVFYQGMAGSIEHVWWDSVSFNYEQYAAPPGVNPPPGQPGPRVQIPNPAAGNPAFMVSMTGQQHVFYRDSLGVIQHVFWNPSDNTFHYEPWTNLDMGEPFVATGDPIQMLTYTAHMQTEQQHVFYRGGSAEVVLGMPGGVREGWYIVHLFWDSSTGFHKEVYAGSATGAEEVRVWSPAAASDPAVMLSSNDNGITIEQHVFYLGMAGSIEHVWFNPNTGFHYEQYAAPPGVNPPPGQPGPRVQIPNPAAGTPATLSTGPDV